MVPDHDGVVPGNGNWALHSQGRYAHSADYVCETACAAGLNVLSMDRVVLRHEAGAAVPGLVLGLQRIAP
jgi:predicted TPR repeat methyltransferase